MKNTVLLIIAVTLSIMSYGQIKSFTLISGKEYPNNTRTQYLQLDQQINPSFHVAIKGKLLSNPLISNFSFYDNADYSQCMYTADLSINGDDIIAIMNKVILSNEEIVKDSETTSKQTTTENKYFFYNFNIENETNTINEIIVSLARNPSVVDVKTSDNKSIKVKTIREMTISEFTEIIDNIDNQTLMTEFYSSNFKENSDLSTKQSLDETNYSHRHETFSHISFINDIYITKFKINSKIDYDTSNILYSKLKKSDIISDVNYLGNSTFEIYSKREISPNEIKLILEELALDIAPESIK